MVQYNYRKGEGDSPKEISKKIKKGLDKLPDLWYNKDVKRERDCKSGSKKSPKKIKKKLLTSRRKCGTINTEREVRDMDEKKAPRKRLTKAELTEVLLKKVNDWIEGGDSPEDAVGRLTDKQYDFLIDQGVDFDSLLLSPEQLKNAQSIMGKQAGRRKGMKYNKKYPQSKQDLFNGIVEYLQGQGAEIMPAERQNFRDLDFTLNGVHYKIVLSNPRK